MVVFVVSVVYGVCCSNGWLCVALSIGSITLSHGFLRIHIFTLDYVLTPTNNVITIPVC